MIHSENIPQILAVKHLPQDQDTIIFPSIDDLFFTSDFMDEKSGAKLVAILMSELGESIFLGVYTPTKNNPVLRWKFLWPSMRWDFIHPCGF